jgi:hypothetical protein
MLKIIIFLIFNLSLLHGINIKNETSLSLEPYSEETNLYKSSYKPEDFYGEWVVVKIGFLFCGNYQDNTLKNIKKTIYDMQDVVNFYEKNSLYEISKSKKLVIKDNYIKEAKWNTSKNNYIDYMSYKHFVAYDDGSDNIKEGFLDGNGYHVLGLLENKKSIPEFGDYIIVNKDKLISKSFYGSDKMYAILEIYIRLEEAKKLKNDKIILEIPYNLNINKGVCRLGDGISHKYKVSKTHIKELDDYANKLMSEGKFTIIRGYARNSAIDNE